MWGLQAGRHQHQEPSSSTGRPTLSGRVQDQPHDYCGSVAGIACERLTFQMQFIWNRACGQFFRVRVEFVPPPLPQRNTRRLLKMRSQQPQPQVPLIHKHVSHKPTPPPAQLCCRLPRHCSPPLCGHCPSWEPCPTSRWNRWVCTALLAAPSPNTRPSTLTLCARSPPPLLGGTW